MPIVTSFNYDFLLFVSRENVVSVELFFNASIGRAHVLPLCITRYFFNLARFEHYREQLQQQYFCKFIIDKV